MSFWKDSPDLLKQSAPITTQGTVLLVDDEPVVRAMTGAVLTAMGWNVLNVSSGEDAIQLMQSAQRRDAVVDMVILDLILPCGLSGLEVARHLREIQPGIKILACSGFFGADGGETCLGMGFNATLAKPFTAEDLGHAVYNCLHASGHASREAHAGAF